MSEILFAEDDAAMRQMVADLLETAGHRVRLARTGAEALDALGRGIPELVILDHRMPPPDGLEVCRRIKTNPRLEHVPVLMLTAEASADQRIEGFGAGADDYLAKPFDARELLARVTALLRLTRQGLDRNPTSGLPGGGAIRREYDRRRGEATEFALCYFDLNDFKPFGDRFGFSLGDRVIRAAGDSLVAAAGEEGFVGHVGGDDFLAICAAARARPLVDTALRRFHAALQKHVPPEVWEAGSYRATDREGRVRDVPLTRLAAAVLYLDGARAPSLDELGETVAATKALAKATGVPAVTDLREGAADGAPQRSPSESQRVSDPGSRGSSRK